MKQKKYYFLKNNKTNKIMDLSVFSETAWTETLTTACISDNVGRLVSEMDVQVGQKLCERKDLEIKEIWIDEYKEDGN